METKIVECLQCGQPVEVLPGLCRCPNAICADCAAQDAQRKAAKYDDAVLRNQWKKVWPAYSNTLVEKLPKQRQSRLVLAWNGPLGLNLWGPPRTGKTRTLYMLLKRLHYSGKHVKPLSPLDVSNELESRSYHRAAWLSRLASVDVLALDDVDKLNLTTEMERSLFCVLDKRAAHNKPVFFTQNSNADEFAKRFKLGGPLLGRVREFCQSIYFGDSTP